MRINIFILLIAMLIMSADAVTYQGPKLNVSTQLNWSGDVNSQIHGVTNGSNSQDVVTYSQAQMMVKRPVVTIGPYNHNDYVVGGGYYINDAINDSLDDGNYNIQLETYTYEQDGPIVFDVNAFKLVGNGNWNTFIKAIGNDTSTQMIIGPTDGNKTVQFLISDLLIYRDRDGDSIDGTIGVEYRCGALYHVWKQTMERVWIMGSEHDLKIGQEDMSSGVSGFTARDCVFGPSAGDYSYDTNPVLIAYSIQTLFDNCMAEFYNESGFRVYNNSANDVTFINCYANGWDVGEYGFEIQNGMVITLVRCGSEANTIADLGVFGGSGHTISGSFFGGAGPGSATGHAMIVSPVNSNIGSMSIYGSHFSYTNGINGGHYGQATIEINNTIDKFVNWVGFDSTCDIMDTGYGAINITNAFAISLIGLRIADYHTSYGFSSTDQAAININGSVESNSIISNCLIDAHKFGIRVSESVSKISIIGNHITGVASALEAVNITTSGSASVTNDHNTWYT